MRTGRGDAAAPRRRVRRRATKDVEIRLRYAAARWNLVATKVDALVERSHLARWARDPTSRPWGIDLIARVVPNDAKISPREGGGESPKAAPFTYH